MISKQQIAHKVQVILKVSEIHIEIRFPCKLQIGIKVGKDETNLNQEVDLKSGLAMFNETLKAESFMVFDTTSRRYLEKKATVTVYVVSPRGKNVAGVFPFDLSSVLNKPSQEQLFTSEILQRCPDKQATISLKIKGYLLEELVDRNISLISDRSGAYIPPNKVFSVTIDRPKIETRVDSRYPTPRLQSNLSQKKLQRNLSENRNKRSIVQQISSPSNRLLLEARGGEYTSKLPHKQDPTTINETFKLRNRIDELQRQVDSLKRELVEKKRLQSEVETLTYKLSELQKVINGNRMEMDTTNNQKRRQNTEYVSKIEELQKLNLTLQKRVDIKSSFYKEQLEKYNGKLLSIENQKQQFVLEISSLKDQIFDLNRKVNGLKDKEKILTDDKLKLTKRIDEFKKQPIERSVENTSKDVMYERLKQTISNNELEKLSLMDELQKLKNQVLNEGIFRIKYEQELKEKNSVIQQKLYLENQHALTLEESTHEANRLTKQLTEKVDEIHLLNSKIVEANSKNKLEVAKLLQQIDTLKATLDFVRGAEEKGRSEYEQLSYAARQNHRQLVESNKKCAELDSTLKEYQVDNDQLQKNLKISTEETRALSLQSQKLNSIIRDFQDQFSLQGESKRKNQEEYKILVQKLEQFNKQQSQQLSNTQQQLFSFKSQLSQQQADFTSELEKKIIIIREKEFELRNILEEETQLQLNNATLESVQAQLKQTIRTLEADLSRQRLQIDNLKKNSNTVQESENTLKELLSSTKSSLEEKEVECQNLIESNKMLQGLLSANRNQFETYKQNMNQHIHGLLKSLVTRTKVQEPQGVEGLPEGLTKLQTDVISKVKNCYEELQVVSQKLLNKEMEQITNEQNNDLQVQTLQIELGQLKKQLEFARNQNVALVSNLENNRGSYLQESQNLQNQMQELEIQLNEQFNIRARESNTNFERDINKLKEDQSKEKNTFQTKTKDLETQLTNLQKQLYDQYNEVNVMSLKNYENMETIKELEERLAEREDRQGFFESDRGKYMADIMYLDSQLHRVVQLNDVISKDLTLALERESLLSQQNEYLRGEFQAKSPTTASSGQFQRRQKSVIQLHRVNSQNSKLNQVLQQLNAKLLERQTTIRVLQQNIKQLGIEVQQKYKNIYQLQNQIKSFKSKLNVSRSRNNISKTFDRDDKVIVNKLKEILNTVNELIINPPEDVSEQMLKIAVLMQNVLALDGLREIKSNSLLP